MSELRITFNGDDPKAAEAVIKREMSRLIQHLAPRPRLSLLARLRAWFQENRTAIGLFVLFLVAWVVGSMADGIGL